MMQVEMKAPAKVNLGLWVLGRREDGYHELWTLMETISLADELALTARQSADVRLTVSGRPAPTGEDNLVIRAGRLLQGRCGAETGADMLLRNVVPVGAASTVQERGKEDEASMASLPGAAPRFL